MQQVSTNKHAINMQTINTGSKLYNVKLHTIHKRSCTYDMFI